MPGCLEWAEQRHEQCGQWADQGYNQCSATADQGYNSCCTWWPCSWACSALVWVTNIVCVAWTWISNVVCVVWNITTTLVCVIWDIVTTVVNAILVTVMSILGWVLSAIAAVVELLEMIPFVGSIIRWVINVVTSILAILGNIPDLILGAVGIRPEKLLRVCTVILRDENGNPVATTDVAVSLLQTAVDVYKRDANVRIVPLRAFKYSSGFAGAETVDESWLATDSDNSGADLLDPSCDASSDWGTTGSGFQLRVTRNCFFGAWRRLTGYGAPLTCFFVRDITDAIGCALWVTDYNLTEGRLQLPHPSPRTLGHECGHSCNLGHQCVDADNRNMMGTQDDCNPVSGTLPDRINPRMNDAQALWVRMSKHVTYF